jgi:AcrR family transcriptional regulator
LTNAIPIGIVLSVDSKSEILSRALELFSSRGYDGVGVQEIVDASGVTKPTLYHHFGSKHGLLQALLALHYESLNAEVRRAAEYHGDLPLTLRNVVKAFFRSAHEDPIFYRMQLAMYFAPTGSDAYREVTEFNKGLSMILQDLFLHAAANHGNMKGRHILYGSTFLGVINHCIGLGLNGYLSLDDGLVEKVVHQFEHGIYS